MTEGLEQFKKAYQLLSNLTKVTSVIPSISHILTVTLCIYSFELCEHGASGLRVWMIAFEVQYTLTSDRPSCFLAPQNVDYLQARDLLPNDQPKLSLTSDPYF